MGGCKGANFDTLPEDAKQLLYCLVSSKADLVRARDLFYAIDTDRSNSLDGKELQSALTKLKAKYTQSALANLVRVPVFVRGPARKPTKPPRLLIVWLHPGRALRLRRRRVH
jgi:hypothetical protein